MSAVKTYLNPVFASSFPDPFVLNFRGEYFAYCTGLGLEGRVFGVLRSRDLVKWLALPGAMEPLPIGGPHYWAPEVTYYNGRFYLYYSVGNEEVMAIRLAVSDNPAGGFVDTGRVLTTQTFAIDAHVFIDKDSGWYMFYATDFLEHSHIGTGTVVDRMIDPFTLEGNPSPVTRPKYDWQVYDPLRKEKGGVRWHTVEGPFVLKRKGTYYEMFSGGNWQNPSYGVSFAVSDNIERKEEWTQYSDGKNVFPILRTVSDRVIGPGHNSVVVGPNNREIYCVYHRWVNDERVLAIDRMDFAGGNRLFVIGPTDTPQPAPAMPNIIDHFDELADERWKILAGNWTILDSELIPADASINEILANPESHSFRCEVSLRFVQEFGTAGFLLFGNETRYEIKLAPGTRRISFGLQDREEVTYALPADIDFLTTHRVRLDVDCRTVRVFLDDIEVGEAAKLDFDIEKIGLFSYIAKCAFSAFSLTAGFEELFENADLGDRGWESWRGDGTLVVENQLLKIHSPGQTSPGMSKQLLPGDSELLINLRQKVDQAGKGQIVFDFGTPFSLFYQGGWKLKAKLQEMNLPDKFRADEFGQLRFKRIGDSTEIFLEEVFLGSIHQNSPDSNRIKISVQNTTAVFDMIRYTAL